MFRPPIVAIIREVQDYKGQAAYRMTVNGKHIYVSIVRV